MARVELWDFLCRRYCVLVDSWHLCCEVALAHGWAPTAPRSRSLAGEKRLTSSIPETLLVQQEEEMVPGPRPRESVSASLENHLAALWTLRSLSWQVLWEEFLICPRGPGFQWEARRRRLRPEGRIPVPGGQGRSQAGAPKPVQRLHTGLANTGSVLSAGS